MQESTTLTRTVKFLKNPQYNMQISNNFAFHFLSYTCHSDCECFGILSNSVEKNVIHLRIFKVVSFRIITLL